MPSFLSEDVPDFMQKNLPSDSTNQCASAGSPFLSAPKDTILLSLARRAATSAQSVGKKSPKTSARPLLRYSPSFSIPHAKFFINPSFTRRIGSFKWYSTTDKVQEDKSTVQLTDSLRKLYLKVHPDFFSQWPDVQAVNEESFQHLMAFLDSLEQLESNASSSPQNERFPIVFFIKDEKSSALLDGATGSIQGLKRANITLESSSYQQSLSAMRRGLGRLFDACDVEHSIEELSEQPTMMPRSQFNREWKEELSFSHFVKRVHETARQKVSLRLSAERELDLERTVFYIQHRIRVHVENTPEMEQSWRARLDVERSMIQRLESCLKTLYFDRHINTEKFADTTVHFGSRSGIDLIGRICLPMAGTNEEWIERLAETDPESIYAIKDDSAERYDLEKRFSDSIGIAFVYTDYSLGGSERYISFIKTLIDAASVLKFRIENADCLKLRILDTESKSSFSTDISTCTVALPISLDPQDVLDKLKEQSADLVEAFSTVNRTQQDLNALILLAKRKFRLRSLTWDPQVSTKQLQNCVTGLIRYATKLHRMLDGQRIHVAFDYHLDDSDGTIHVRWDFMV